MEKPTIEKMVPVLGIDSYDDAVAHYVNWLGFNLDWEWREAPGQPVIMAISRDSVSFMLNEHDDKPGRSTITLHVQNLESLAEEWNGKRPDSAAIVVEPPYDIPTIYVTDGYGNALHFHGENPVESGRDEFADKMRAFIQEKLDNGEPFPTPEEVVKAVGSVVGLAIEMLNEFPGYEEAYRARQK